VTSELDDVLPAPDTPESEPEPVRVRRRRWPVVLGIIAVVGVMLTASVAAYAFHEIGGSSSGPPVTVTIPTGASGAQIASILASKNVVRSRRGFRLYTKVAGMGLVQSGEYHMRERMSVRAALALLHKGPFVKYDTLVIPEGLTFDQIAARVGRLPNRTTDRFVALASSGTVRSAYQPQNVTSLEGLLFPDTYQFTVKEDEAAILSRLVGHFDQVANQLQVPARAAALGLTPYQLIIVASLVESEAKVAEDRPLIASVILNRLSRHMRLQIDATVLYALGRHKTVVLNKDLEVNSPYNTYKIDGLPPTPIGAAGQASIEAVLNAPKTDYLYYVLIDENGKHGFARTEAEFNALIAQAKRNGVRK